MLVYAPYTWPGHFGLLAVAIFVAAALAISAGLLAMTIARLRRFVLPAEVGRRKRKLPFPALGLPWLRAGLAAIRRWRERLPGPSLDGNPVLWREWHRSRPSRMARILWVVYWLGAVGTTALGIHDAVAYGIDSTAGGFMIHTTLFLQSVTGPRCGRSTTSSAGCARPARRPGPPSRLALSWSALRSATRTRRRRVLD